MDRELTPAAARLVREFGDAFPAYVRRRLRELAVVSIPLDVTALTAELKEELTEVLVVPPRRQDRSPLEVIRHFLDRVGAALAGQGVAAAERDEAAVAMHPSDRYALYPASSRDLGERAWRAHLEWGFEKARLVAGVVPAGPRRGATGQPAVALFGLERPLRDSLADGLTTAGYRALVWRNPAALGDGLDERPVLTIVALGHPAAHDAIRAVAQAGLQVVAVSGRVEDFTTAGIMALGATDVVESNRILDRLDGLLPRLV
jgi:hypothetical protein